MQNINIEQLLNCKTGGGKAIDVNSLTRKNTFNVQKILKNREKRREKLSDIYIKMYNRCLRKIEIASSQNRTDLIFNVDPSIKDLPEYTPLDCILYIDNELKHLNMNTHIINNNTIFITWYFIEANIAMGNENI